MPTECNPQQLEFQGHGFRKVVSDFSGGRITSDAGGLLLREVATGTKLLEQFAECFIDNRNQDLIEHTKLELLSQRIFGIALGYEDLYCARGDMENRIKEQQLCLFTDRTSSATFP